jgi:hypothetical protein
MTTEDSLDHILNGLGAVRARRPELRFGQLVAIVGELAQDETSRSLWDVEDAEFAAALDRFAGDLARSESCRTEPSTAPEHGGGT